MAEGNASFKRPSPSSTINPPKVRLIAVSRPRRIPAGAVHCSGLPPRRLDRDKNLPVVLTSTPAPVAAVLIYNSQIFSGSIDDFEVVMVESHGKEIAQSRSNFARRRF
ncbi:hypothetical protein J6590_007021 [Homalodisca vitripennis]|nr:hypothetical protein J6590_007021 [Homalodisca vitripennis]